LESWQPLQRFAADQRGSDNKRALSKRKEVGACLRRDDNDTVGNGAN
jgi:hypothetical protein